MIVDLTEILALVREAGSLGFLVFLRIGPAMAVLPAFGEQSVPMRVRLALALAFTIVVAPAVTGHFPSRDLSAAFPALWLSEAAVGLVLGIAVRLAVMALQIAGSIAAQSVSLSQLFTSAGAEPQPVIGQLFVLAGLAIAVTLGLHVELAEALADSYETMPPGAMPAAGELLAWAVLRIGGAFALGFSLAMPFVIGSLLYNVALGIINRAMPQLMVAFVGAPALTAGGLFLLLMSVPVLMPTWTAALRAILDAPL